MSSYSFLCRSLVALALVFGLGAGSATAAPIVFNFTGSNSDGSVGNQRAYTDVGSGLSVYVTAFFHDGIDLNPAAVGRYSSGLGGCNSAEDGATFPCDSPHHAVDNNGQQDYLLFLFSGAVDLTSISVSEVQGNTDVSYWLGHFAGGTAGQLNYLTDKTWANLAALGFGARQDNNGDGSRTVALNSPADNYTALLFGASALPKGSGSQTCVLWIFCDGGQDDYFKINGMTVDYTTPPPTRTVTETPEPATFVLLGMGLVGVGAARRRRLASKR